ncbi:MAG: ABC transporter ATP-binding protein [bacterium]|nr:ABC transporter ATP-binding protein [bacterium]
MPLLSVKNLKTYFFTSAGTVKAVDDISFDLQKGEMLALVGESGCGKSVTALSVLNLVPAPGTVVSGQIQYGDKDILKLGGKDIRKIRGKDISMIFQEPMTSLNPVFTVGNQVCEVFTVHKGFNKKDAKDSAIHIFGKVRIPDPERIFNCYPHQLSGGMQQRVMIAMALACGPSILIADEPTTALDVTIQAQILELIGSLRKDFSMSVIFITHDLGIVSGYADRIHVMYAGKIVEKGFVKNVISEPVHPYTKGLLDSLPMLGGGREKLEAIPGQVPGPLNRMKGCKFQPRCSRAVKKCLEQEPGLFDIENGGCAACFNPVPAGKIK